MALPSLPLGRASNDPTAMPTARRLPLLGFAALALTTAFATAQVPGTSREQMWWAPTAEDWKKPVLIEFQRSWDDALAVAKETGKPILVCVNMDGEIASEHYAGVRYRMPEMAKLYEPYVCVMASVYRHNPRDYDEQGNRIPCPRFGCVTCGEHIALEPLIYEKFLDGVRVAPRHIMVEPDGTEVYDVYYAFDTDSVFKQIADGIAERDAPPPKDIVRGDRSILERVASHHQEDRVAVEQAYAQGDAETKRKLIEKAAEHASVAQVGLLRLAVFDVDAELNQKALEALAKIRNQSAVPLMADALQTQVEGAQRDALVTALDELGEDSQKARMLASVHKGFAKGSSNVNATEWAAAMKGQAYPAPPGWNDLQAKLEAKDAAATTEAPDPSTRVEAAIASLQIAVDPANASSLGANRRAAWRQARVLLEDAKREALAAEQQGAEGWRVQAALGVAHHYLREREESEKRVAAAVPAIETGANDWLAMSTLALFADMRRRQISDAVRAKADWPGEWLTDLHAAFSVLSQHPLGTATHVITHYDFLWAFGASGAARKALDAGLERFPNDWLLHDRMRSTLLLDRGVDGMEQHYEQLVAERDGDATIRWFAGYTSIVAAEFHRRKNRDAQAIAAYDRAIAHYDSAIAADPSTEDTSDHYASIALGGKARLALESKNFDAAMELVQAAFDRRPIAAGAVDGLNFTSVMTAQMLRSQLADAGRTEDAAKIQAAMAALPPEALEPPEYDRPPGQTRRGQGQRRRRGR